MEDRIQSVARPTQEPYVSGSIPDPATYYRFPTADSRKAAVSYLRKYMHLLVNLFGGLRLPRYIVRTLNPQKCNFNAPAIRKNFFSKFDKYNILAL